MSDAPPAAPPVIAPQYIDQDMPCVGCGYNLRGLTADRPCPECGVPVGRSLHGDRLLFCDPGWLNAIRRGTTLMLWSILVAVVGEGLEVGLREADVPPLIALAPSLAAAALGAYAVFLLTEQEPRIAFTEQGLTLRRIVRYCAIAAVAGEVFYPLAETAQFSGALRLVLVILCVLAGLADLVATFGKYIYLRRFARRIPDNRLARSTTVVMWGSVISGAFAVLAVLLAATAGRVWLVVVCVPGVGLVVFGIWSIVLLVRYNRELKRIAKMAVNPELRLAPAVDLRSVPPPPPGPIGRRA